MDKTFSNIFQDLFNEKTINAFAKDTTKKLAKNVSKFLNEIKSDDEEEFVDDEDNQHLLLMDIYENNEIYIILIDIPGCQKDNISVDIIKDNVLIIHVKFENFNNIENLQLIKKERLNGIYKRKITLPDLIDQESIVAKYEKGVLQLSFKKIIKKSTSIPIL